MALPNIDETRRQNTILATTAANITPVITNNALNAHAGSSIFAGELGDKMFGPGPMKGKAMRTQSGESIEVRAQLSKSTSAGWMTSGYDTFSQDVQDTARVLRANWKLAGGTAIISGEERRNNSGMAQIANLLEYKMTEAVQGVSDLFAETLYNGDGINEVTGLDTIIGANDTLQNCNGNTTINWNSRGLSAKGTAANLIAFAGGSFAAQGVSDWITAFMNASEGSIQPEFLLTTEPVYRFYEGSIAPEIRYNSLSVGDGSFRNLTFKGKPIFHDSYATSGVTYFINTDHLYLAVAPGAAFDMTPIDTQQFQDVFSSKVLFQGNFVTSARKFQNKVTSQTA